MLRHLQIRDFALVQALQIDLQDGLTVITGESGAGKTILLGALGMVLGARADSTNIRPGADRAVVSAEFQLPASATSAFLEERGLTDAEQPDRCLLRRTLNRDGRSRAYINGTPVTRQELATFSADLIDIHSQHEHQALQKRHVQLALLDDFAGHAALLAEVRAAHGAWQRAERQLASQREHLTQAEDRRALLDYQVPELQALGLGEGDFEALETRFRRLAKRQDIEIQIGQALALLEGEDGSGVSQLQQLARRLGDLDDAQPALDAARELLAGALNHLDEAGTELRQYQEALTTDPGELAELEQRMDQIMTLARKHRVRPEALARLTETLSAELDALSVDRASLGTLEAEAREGAQRFRALADELRRSRRAAAAEFEQRISACLRELGIQGGALRVTFSEAESETGIDAVDYHVVTNPKYPPAPLTRIASGGEQSRMSLAIQVIAAERSRLPTLVLDEADVGIGGTTAEVVGQLLRRIAAHTQVLCVTHAPQVAAQGHQHLCVTKDPERDTEIAPLMGDARVSELARMLGGRDIGEKTRAFASELIAAADAANA